MKFKIDGKLLKDAAALVDAAVNAKSEIPDHSHVFLMTNGQGGLYLIGRNDRFMVKVSGIPVTEDEAGSILVHASRWQRLIGESGGRTVEIDSDDTTNVSVRLYADGNKPSKFDLKAMSADQYVPLAVTGTGSSCVVDKLHLRDGLKLVRPTADSDNSLDIANGVCFEFDANQIRLIATDMSTLGYAEVATDWGGSALGDKITRVLPREALDLVEKMAANMADSDIAVHFSDTLVSFTTGNTEVVSSILANGQEYINWQRIIPTDIDGSNFTATSGSIVSAMSLAEIVNGGDAVSVDFELAGGMVVVTSVGIGGTHNGEITANGVFGDSTFRLDSRLVKNALRGLDSGTVLHLAPVNEGKQLQVTPTLPNLGDGAFQIWGTKTRKEAA